MFEPLIPILIVITVCAGLTIYGKYKQIKLYYTFKPAASILIFVMPLVFIYPQDSFDWFVLAGLMTAIVGDVLLMFPARHFTKGLTAFLATHIFYIAAFISLLSEIYLLSLIPFVTFAYLIFSRLNIVDRKLQIPVLIYTITISIMGLTAFNVWLINENERSLMLFLASLLFILSDSILAYNKFTRKFRSAELIILASYFIAQTIFSVSLVLTGKV